MKSDKGLTYRDAGVDIEAGNALVDRIKPLVAATRRPEVLGGLGGFGGLFALPEGLQQPILVSGTDGVGTKLKLAQAMQRHDTIGIDLVAMCVNDVVVQGAEPLFFLDYFATGKLDNDVAADVVAGIARGCAIAGCSLIGGETAEMPDMYAPGEYDLAGFNVGVVERASLMDGSRIAAGDVIIGLESSGPHSNGYSLIRKVLEHTGSSLDEDLGSETLGDALLEPTRIYVKPILDLLAEIDVHGLAHITGGGLRENIIRCVPDGLGIVIDQRTWPRPPVFRWLREGGNIEALEMLTTFNCGIGFTVIVEPALADDAIKRLAEHGIDAWVIGEIATAEPDQRVRFSGL